MFRILRLIVLCIAAFVAGMIYERYNIKRICSALDGQDVNGICIAQEDPALD